MKKILVLILAIVVVASAGLGFGATSISNTNDPINIGNIDQNLGNNDDNVDQIESNTDNISQEETNTNEIDQNDNNNAQNDEDNVQNDENGNNWYKDGFWKDTGNGEKLWGDNNRYCDDDNKCDDNDKCNDKNKCDDKDKCNDNKDNSKIEIHNSVTVTANGGNAQSNAEIQSISGSKAGGISSEIEEFNFKNQSNKVPMQETGLPVVPALLSTLFIGSGLLYRRLRR